jgi:hypothetical protein
MFDSAQTRAFLASKHQFNGSGASASILEATRLLGAGQQGVTTMANCVMDLCEDDIESSVPVLRTENPRVSTQYRYWLACRIALLDEITLAEAHRQVSEQLTSGCIDSFASEAQAEASER